MSFPWQHSQFPFVEIAEQDNGEQRGRAGEQRQRQQNQLVQLMIKSMISPQPRGHLMPASLLQLSSEGGNSQQRSPLPIGVQMISPLGSSSPMDGRSSFSLPPLVPASIADIRRIMAKIGDHPLQFQLRRALRAAAVANKNGESKSMFLRQSKQTRSSRDRLLTPLKFHEQGSYEFVQNICFYC